MDTSIDATGGAVGAMPFALTKVFDKLQMSQADIHGLSFVLLVGSFAEGLNSPTSDVDLVFVSEEPSSIADSGQFAKCFVEGRHVEIWNLGHDEFQQHVEVADAQMYRGLPTRQLELTHKLVNAVCLSGRMAYEPVVVPRRRLFANRLSNYFSQSGEGVFKDVLGAKRSMDYWTAAAQARELVGFAADSYLAFRGDTYPKRKWRLRRLHRLADIPNLTAEYIAVEFGGPNTFDGDGVRSWIERCLALVRSFQCNQHCSEAADQVQVAERGIGLSYMYPVGESFVIRTETTVVQLPVAEALALLSGRHGEIHAARRGQMLELGLVNTN